MVSIALYAVPVTFAVGDAKVATGRQKPLLANTELATPIGRLEA